MSYMQMELFQANQKLQRKAKHATITTQTEVSLPAPMPTAKPTMVSKAVEVNIRLETRSVGVQAQTQSRDFGKSWSRRVADASKTPVSNLPVRQVTQPRSNAQPPSVATLSSVPPAAPVAIPTGGAPPPPPPLPTLATLAAVSPCPPQSPSSLRSLAGSPLL